MFRFLKTYRTEGGTGIRYRARGKAPNNQIHDAKRDYAVALVKEKYEDFGPTLAAEMLRNTTGSRSRVRHCANGCRMQDAGLWLSRKQRRTFHQPRSRRECFGELNIEILCANSSQAKGRVERANRTLQDRLVKELRLADISSIEDGNVFLPGFIERYNAKFANAPARSDTLHRPLNIAPDRMSEVFCLRDKRHVTKDLMLKYGRKRIELAENDPPGTLAAATAAAEALGLQVSDLYRTRNF